MRLNVIGHATCFVETSGPTILVDPWLFGSAYWRSWWHYPPSPQPAAQWLAPDFLYLTHHHPDHFHYPSMRRIDRRAEVLVPEFGVDVMAGEVRGLGFPHVRELPHGHIVDLGSGVRVASYQYGTDDTVFVVADGDDVVVDVNDCKIRGRALRRVLDDFGPPTFMLKSHSWAQAYPFNYTADDPADLTRLRRESYWHDFIHVARALGPRYAVPFGSMVAFLHPDSEVANQLVVTPPELAEHFAAADALGGTELIVMGPGDVWDSTSGFHISRHDWYASRTEELERMKVDVADKIDAQTKVEDSHRLEFDTFERYFRSLMRALPAVVRRRALPRPVVFDVPSSAPLRYWELDFARRTIRRTRQLDPTVATVVSMSEGLVADAIDKRVLHLVHPGVRVRVHLSPGGFDEDTAFWLFLMMWELGYLPLRRTNLARIARVVWRRRTEALGYVDAFRAGGTGSFQERMIGAFAHHDQD